jgi:hypothetical protein
LVDPLLMRIVKIMCPLKASPPNISRSSYVIGSCGGLWTMTRQVRKIIAGDLDRLRACLET